MESKAAPESRLAGPVLDSPNPLGLAAFYERLIGWPIARSEGSRPDGPPEDGWALLRSPDGSQKLPQEDVRVMIDPHGHPFCLFPDQQ